MEVSSPTTASYDRRVKRPAYQAAGVAEYWIVDLDSRLIERWRPEDERPEIAIETISWEPRGAELPLRIDLGQWFAAVLE